MSENTEKKLKQTLKVHITGMGGQGIGSTSRILSTAAGIANLSVTTTETHGLAQRGGVVVSDLAIGYDPEESPICSNGEADVLIALEAVESLRSMSLLRKDGIAIVNTTKYQPVTVRISKGEINYPSLDEIKAELLKRTPHVILVNAMEDSRDLGLSQAMNVILLGALVGNTDILPFSADQIKEAIAKNVPAKYKSLNLKAFDRGFEYKI